MNEIDLLRRYFPQFEPALIDQLAALGRVVDFDADEVVMRTGQYVKSALIVLDGRIKLYREGEDGGEFFLYYLGPGEACALSMICAMRQETSALRARAMTAVRALAIPMEHLDGLMRGYRSWSEFVLASYRTRFEEVLQVLDQVVFNSMDEKLEFYLRRQFQVLGDRLTVTHQEIATDLNSSREVVSRLLKKMESRGLVRIHRNGVERGNMVKNHAVTGV